MLRSTKCSIKNHARATPVGGYANGKWAAGQQLPNVWQHCSHRPTVSCSNVVAFEEAPREAGETATNSLHRCRPTVRPVRCTSLTRAGRWPDREAENIYPQVQAEAIDDDTHRVPMSIIMGIRHRYREGERGKRDDCLMPACSSVTLDN